MLVSKRLDSLLRAGHESVLRGGLKGLEKESLRLSETGQIAQTPHPAALGSALTHPWITTDYSEALIELITPPFARVEETLGFLADLHRFVYGCLENELLLATSMPIGLDGDESIPIARYGQSNIGQMKHIYRRGLAYRYGRTMQSIAGLHFNYSFNEHLWPILQDLEQSRKSPTQFIADRYFGVIRNIHRYGWVLIYLFGNSPAVCKSFFKGRESLTSMFAEFDSDTLYRPWATSLRMSDIGYRNANQTSLGISFNSVDEYVASLEKAIHQPYPPYQSIGVKVDGEYRQLNANILQIENEYYSSVRPKQITHSGEKPTLALKKRGVRYLELRSVDLMCTSPEGINLDQLRFLEVFVIFCLLAGDEPLTLDELSEANQNGLGVACCSRGLDFRLLRQGNEVPLQDWAGDILEQMQLISTLLDEGMDSTPYRDSVKGCLESIASPEATQSARVLHTMRDNQETFAEFALGLSRRHASHWLASPLGLDRFNSFTSAAEVSWQEQERLESSDRLTLEQFLARYDRQA